MLVFEGRYFKIFLVSSIGKTNIYDVISYRSVVLGRIKWYSKWRMYCFFSEQDMLYSGGCLEEIAQFIKQLMQERKK